MKKYNILCSNKYTFMVKIKSNMCEENFNIKNKYEYY